MPKFSANISMLFGDRPLVERFAAAAACGFDGVEIQFPYDEPAETLARAAGAARLPVALFNVAAGDLRSGGPGLAAMSGREAAFAAALEEAVAYARILKPAKVNVLAGRPPADLPRETCLAVLAANLRRATEALAPIGVGVVTEAINTIDTPGFLISTTREAIAAVDRAGYPGLSIQYDVYHMHQMEGAVIDTITRLAPRIGHIQFADVPGRGEPGTGALDFPAIFAAVDQSGYRGWVGAEYRPRGRTEDGLGWLAAARR